MDSERKANASIAAKFEEIYQNSEAYKLVDKAIKQKDYELWDDACKMVGIPPGQAKKAWNYIVRADMGNTW